MIAARMRHTRVRLLADRMHGWLRQCLYLPIYRVELLKIYFGTRIEKLDITQSLFTWRANAAAFAYDKARHKYRASGYFDEVAPRKGELVEAPDGCYSFPDSDYPRCADSVTLSDETIDFDQDIIHQCQFSADT